MAQDPTQYLKDKLDEIIEDKGVPGLGAVLVRNNGDTTVKAVRGIRKSDVSKTKAENQLAVNDRFSLGSVSKPVTGFLISRLIQMNKLEWTTRVIDVFPEFQKSECRKKFGMRSDYLQNTVQDFMAHSARQRYAPINGFEMIFGNFSGAHLTEYNTNENRMWRRYLYVINSMQDPPLADDAPSKDRYSGGSIVCAAMAERIMDKSYESLLDDLVFDPLGMAHSGVGRLAIGGTPDGPWQHPYDPDTGTVTPSPDHNMLKFNYNSHAPAGAVNMSVGDMGIFIRQQFPNNGKPKLLVPDSLLLQAQEDVSPITGYTRGGWSRSGSGTQMKVAHNGNNCASFAQLTVQPNRSVGYAAFCHTSTCATNPDGTGKPNIGQQAVNLAIAALVAMDTNWLTLFV